MRYLHLLCYLLLLCVCVCAATDTELTQTGAQRMGLQPLRNRNNCPIIEAHNKSVGVALNRTF
jgi:hypothetical protein